MAHLLACALASSPTLLASIESLLREHSATAAMEKQLARSTSRRATPSCHGASPAAAEALGEIDELVPLATVKQITGLGKTTIYALVRQGEFPAPYKPGGAATRWSLAEVLAWRRRLKPIR